MTKRSSNSRIWNEARTRIATSLRFSPARCSSSISSPIARASSSRIPGAGDGDLLAVDILGAQRLAEPAFIVRDQMRGRGEDVAGGAVVALEADDLGAGKIVVEAQDVVDLGAAPAIDRLVVVADAADVFEAAALTAPSRVRAQPSCIRRRSSRRCAPADDVPRSDSTLPRAAPATAAAATDTARRWCPDIRRPG